MVESSQKVVMEADWSRISWLTGTIVLEGCEYTVRLPSCRREPRWDKYNRTIWQTTHHAFPFGHCRKTVMNRISFANPKLFSPHVVWVLLAGALICWSASPGAAQGTGHIEVDIVEELSGKPLTCRVRLKGQNDRDLRIRGGLYQNGWNLVESPLKFEGRPGDYRYEVSAGPRFSRGLGGFTLDRKSAAIDSLRLPQHCDLDLEGWYGGDLYSCVKPAETAKWLAAADLVMAAVVHTEVAQGNPASEFTQIDTSGTKWVDARSYYDARAGSGLILHHWTPPRAVPEHVPSSKLLELAKENRQTHAEIQRLWARDTPLWLASNKVDSIQLLSDHLTDDGQGAAEVKTLANVDAAMFRGPRGGGRLVEFLYWQMLESGLRIPPSAGSGVGKSPASLGYNRVYVMTGNPSPAAWWESLRAGQSFVTNGPLLRVQVNGYLPGQVLTSTGKSPIELDIGLTLTVADPVEYLDVIFNGQTLYQARLDEFAKQGGKIPPQVIKESGWLVIRVVTERDFTYRIATTAPYYFEFDGQARISRQAVELFQRWLEQAAAQLSSDKEPTRAAVQPYVQAARRFWAERLKQANVP